MDFSNHMGLIRALVPKIPLILSTAVAHTLSLSPTSHDWDLRTELIIRVLHSFLDPAHPAPLSKTQRLSTRDPGVKGPLWVSRVEFAPPPDQTDGESVRASVQKAFRALGNGDECWADENVAPTSVQAEWTGHRSGVHPGEPEIDGSEADKYRALMAEVESDVTILYFHGGGYFLLDPASHRPVTAQLARLTHGRCLSVRYRLAPQNPFPAALMDALVVYLSLLYPPPGSLHEAVPASKMVFAGDSAGGGLAMSLLQLILALRRDEQPGTVQWHGEVPVSVPLPAGVATNSPWLDITRSMPSVTHNAKYDYLPQPLPTRFGPADSIWPSDPPRAEIYAHSSSVLHPLVSPVTAPSWHNAPPLHMCVGEELLTDDGKFVAARAAAQGVPVVLDEYRAMPHCFGLIFRDTYMARKCFDAWATFARTVVENPGQVTAKGTVFAAKSLAETDVDVAAAIDLSMEDVKAAMSAAHRKRLDEFKGRSWALPKL